MVPFVLIEVRGRHSEVDEGEGDVIGAASRRERVKSQQEVQFRSTRRERANNDPKTWILDHKGEEFGAEIHKVRLRLRLGHSGDGT
jgi:hypothetical protein